MLASDSIYLNCPCCKGDLELLIVSAVEDRVRNGILFCVVCRQNYPILDDILIFFPTEERSLYLSPEDIQRINLFVEMPEKYIKRSPSLESSLQKKITSGKNWEKQFTAFFPVLKEELGKEEGFWGENSFYNFTGLSPQMFNDKVTAIFCGGSGREAYHVSKTNSKKIFVVDIGKHIHSLPSLLKNDIDKFIFIRCDTSKHPIKDNVIDIAICDHSLQHIEDYKNAYQKIAKTINTRGVFSSCVYSHENNFIMIKIGEPLRKIFNFLPLPGIRLLALIPAIILYQTTIFYIILLKLVPKFKFPLSDLFLLWWKNGFKKFWEASFDLLHAPISHHFKKDEMISLAQNSKVELIKLINTNDTLWTMVVGKQQKN